MTLMALTSLATAGYGIGKDFFGGTNDTYSQKPRLNKRQRPIEQQLYNAAQNRGAGGAFGDAADFYRDLIDPNSQTAQMMFAPEMRRFNEEIIPGISEQFAGMGAGGLSSSGFRNSAINAGTDLSERLGAIRANLRAQGAAGLANIGNLSLGDYTNNVYQQGQPGFLESAAPGIGAAGTAAAYDYFRNKSNQTDQAKPTASAKPWTGEPIPGILPQYQSTKGTTSPYGNLGLPGQAKYLPGQMRF